MNTHPSEYSTPILPLAKLSEWPVEKVDLTEFGTSVIVHHFKHPEPLDDRPTLLLLPDCVLDARASWHQFLSSHAMHEHLDGLNVLAVNYPGAAHHEDGQTFDAPAEDLPSFEVLGRIICSLVDQFGVRGCLGAGVGMGASLLSYIASMDATVFRGLLLSTPPRAWEPVEYRAGLATDYTAEEGFNRSYVDRWTNDRWLHRSEDHKFTRTERHLKHYWTRLTRPYSYTYNLIRNYQDRPRFDMNITCPVLYLHSLAMPNEVALDLADVTKLPDAMIVGMGGNIICCPQTMSAIEFHVVCFLYSCWPTMRLDHLKQTLLPTTQKEINNLARTCSSRDTTERLQQFITAAREAIDQHQTDLAKEEFRYNLAESDWEGSRWTGWWDDIEAETEPTA